MMQLLTVAWSEILPALRATRADPQQAQEQIGPTLASNHCRL